MIPGVKFIIYGCSSTRKTSEVSLYWSLTLEENIAAVITQDRVIDDNLIYHITFFICRLFLLT